MRPLAKTSLHTLLLDLLFFGERGQAHRALVADPHRRFPIRYDASHLQPLRSGGRPEWVPGAFLSRGRRCRTTLAVRWQGRGIGAQ